MSKPAGRGKKASSPKDLVMLLLYAKGHTGRVCEPIRGRTRLMKTVFLLKEELLPKMRLKQSLSRDAFPVFY